MAMIGVPTSPPTSVEALVHADLDGLVPRLVVERRSVRRVETDRSQTVGGVEVHLLVVVDARAVVPVELEEGVVALGGTGRLHHPQQAVGEHGRLVERRVLRRIVLELEADRPPRHGDVPVRFDLVVDPACGGPTERAGGIDPEFDVHEVGAFHGGLVRVGGMAGGQSGSGRRRRSRRRSARATEALDLGGEVERADRRALASRSSSVSRWAGISHTTSNSRPSGSLA